MFYFFKAIFHREAASGGAGFESRSATCWICSRSSRVQIHGHDCKWPTAANWLLLPAGVLNPVMLYLNYLFSKYLLVVKRFGSLREKRYISVYYHYYYYYYYYYNTSFRLSRPFLVNGTDWCKW